MHKYQWKRELDDDERKKKKTNPPQYSQKQISAKSLRKKGGQMGDFNKKCAEDFNGFKGIDQTAIP